MDRRYEDRGRLYEETLKKIRGVIGCRVVMSSSGEIEEIHILAEDVRPAKRLLRDVESALMAGHGVSFDRRKVSIAMVSQEKVTSPARVRLTKTEMIAEDRVYRVKVTLVLGSNEMTGEAWEEKSERGWIKVAVRACLEALSLLISRQARISLVDAHVVRMKDRDIALVALWCTIGREEHLLTGSCPVGTDEREAAIRATLDAINRKLPLLLKG